jgi:hypothetical protein
MNSLRERAQIQIFRLPSVALSDCSGVKYHRSSGHIVVAAHEQACRALEVP